MHGNVVFHSVAVASQPNTNCPTNTAEDKIHESLIQEKGSSKQKAKNNG